MKKIILFLLTICIIFSSAIIAAAEDDITIYIDGIELQSDKAPYIDNGRTMVPMRKIFESLDATIDWEGDTQTITATKGTIEIKLQIGNATLIKNSTTEILDVAPVIVGDTTFVPARAVAQALGTNVEWLADISAVNITSPGVETIKDYPAIVLPNWKTLGAYLDYSNEFRYSYSIPNITDDMVTEDIPKKIENVIEDWFETLESKGWKRTKPKDAYHFMDYSFAQDEKSDCMYGFEFYLGTNFDEYAFVISPYEYEIIYKDTGEFKKVREGEKTAYDYALEGWSISWPKKFTIYDSNNNSIDVYDYEAIPYLNKGWSKEPNMVTMYAPDWRTISVGVQEVEAYKSVGWYTEPVTLMYAADGRTRYTIESEIEAYENVGWSTEPYTVTLYDIYGYSSEIPQHEVEEYLQNGWYYEPVTKMYAEDGRTMYVADSEVEAYEAVGWYTFPPELNQHLINPDYNSDNDDSYRSSTVYVAASGNGTKYHYRSTCIKNSRSMNINDARNLGYTACSKCAK